MLNPQTRLVTALAEVPPQLPQPASILDYGLFAIAAFYCLRHFFADSSKSKTENWEMLEGLVKYLQDSNAELLKTNRLLAEQLSKNIRNSHEQQRVNRQVAEQLSRASAHRGQS